MGELRVIDEIVLIVVVLALFGAALVAAAAPARHASRIDPMRALQRQ